jgi:hypothetical protein
MNDYFTLNLKEKSGSQKSILDCKDSQSDTGHSLLVHVAATHAGIINGNMRFYRPDKMQEGVHTWLPEYTKDGTTLRTARPVLVGHNEKGDVLGRVLEAKYIDESWKYAGEHPKVKEFLFYQRDGKRRHNLFDSVDYVIGNLMPLKEYTGLGYTDLGIRITNPDAIRKILADEYLTVSVGFKTDSAICSACHTDWAVDGKCEHKLGELIDGQQMFLISGCFQNQELSFINFAADPFATTISKKVLTDSLEKMFFLGLSVDIQRDIKTAGLEMTDGLYESDLIATEEPMAAENTNSNSPVSVEDQNTDEAIASELSAFIEDAQSEAEDAKKKAKKKEEEEGEVESGPSGQSGKKISAKSAKKTKVVQQAEIASCELEGGDCNWDSWESEATDEEKEYFSDTDGIYQELEDEIDAAVKDGELPEEVAKDAKLSTEARSKLSSGTFCGPGKSFPVPDCAHVTAARRLIGRAKVSDATKAKILACVSRKATTLKCGVSKKKDEVEVIVEETKYTDRAANFISSLSQSDAMKEKEPITEAERLELVEIVTTLDKAYDKLSAKKDSTAWQLRWLIRAILTDWDADDEVRWAIERLKGKDYVVQTKSEAEVITSSVDKLTTEKEALSTEITGLKDSRQVVVNASKKVLAQQIVMHGVLTGQEAYKGLTNDQLDEKITDLSRRNISSLKDSVKDILENIQWIKQTDSVSTTVEPQKQMDDNARVTEDVVRDNQTDSQQNTEEADKALTALRTKLYFMTPLEQRRYLAAIK